LPLFLEVAKFENKINIMVDRINKNIQQYGEEIAALS